MVQPVSVVLDRNSFVLLRNAQLLDVILLQKLKVGPIAKHLSHFQLVNVPVFIEARFDIAFSHVKDLPMDVGAEVADEDSVGDIEMSAFVLATLDTESVEWIFSKQLIDQNSLLHGLALMLRFRYGLRRCFYMNEVGVWGQEFVWLLLW